MSANQIDALMSKTAGWLVGDCDRAGIVLSSRVRLARNLSRRIFTHYADDKQLEEIRGEVVSVLKETQGMRKAHYIDMDGITRNERILLAERRLISREMVEHYDKRSLAVQGNEKLSVMINEEDHLRLQSIEPGLSVRRAFDRVDKLDDRLDRRLEFAFSEKLGYLTACPTNVGTGLRISAMVHLPGLVRSDDIRQVIEGLRQVRLTVRGSYGEGSDVVGDFFQISNNITLGQSETDMVKDLEIHVKKVIEFEKKARKELIKEARTLLEDKVWRAYGLLKNARLINSKEAMALISTVRMGVGLGIIGDLKFEDINKILITIQPMHIQRRYGEELTAENRDRMRANYIRKSFS
jgi:protein arginine kinase